MGFKIKSWIIVFPTILLAFGSCKKDSDKSEFDRNGMLTNISSVVIMPAIANMDAKLDTLHTKALTYTANPNSLNLNELKTTFLESYMTFQTIKMFNFGPVEDYGIVSAMNTYPTDTTKIQSNISSGSYSLELATNITAIGLPALDYLLYHSSESQTISNFSTSPNAANTKTYLTDLTLKMKNEFSNAKNAWDNYQTVFNSADGNDVGGSTGILFNCLLQDIELIKNAKIGIPAGYQTAGQTLPNYVEGYYSQISIDLAIENLTALQNVFKGGNGSGYDDYIKDVEDESITISLADNVDGQFEMCKSKLNSLSVNLSAVVNSNPTQVEEAWLEIKKLLTYAKTDVSSILGLLITFQDNDGD